MNESKYSSYLKREFYKKYPFGFWFKIPDYFGKDGNKKPFDSFFISKETGFGAVEVKIHKKLSPFCFDKVELHQIDALRKIRNNKGLAFLIVGIRSPTTIFDRKKIGKDFAEIKIDLWFPVDLIPGHGTNISVKKFMVRDYIASLSDIKGNVINAIVISWRSFGEFTK